MVVVEEVLVEVVLIVNNVVGFVDIASVVVVINGDVVVVVDFVVVIIKEVPVEITLIGV